MDEKIDEIEQTIEYINKIHADSMILEELKTHYRNWDAESIIKLIRELVLVEDKKC